MAGEAIARRIAARVREGKLPCVEAFALAEELGIPPAEVAAIAEAEGYRIGWCQLGLFGGRGKEAPAVAAVEVPLPLREQIQAHLEDGHLPCPSAWGIARRLGVERIEVGRAADALGVRISRCLLGCFS